MARADEIPKVALITGAALRIGRSIAEALVKDGWAVAVHHRDSEKAAKDLVTDINAHGGRAIAIRADFSDESQVVDLADKTVNLLGPVGCLINNAAVFDYDDVLTATRKSWQTHLEVNLRAPFVLTQAFAKALPENARGCIINIIDQRVWNLTPHFSSYTLSKAALWTLTQTAALALAPRIRVNAIGPGPVLPSARQTPVDFEAQCARTPLGRAVSTEEICAAIHFILRSPGLTGQMIAVDAGQHLGWAMPPKGEAQE